MGKTRLSVFGATGSIGDSTLDLVRSNPDKFEIVALTAASNVDKLAALAKEFSAEAAIIADEAKAAELKDALSGTNIPVSAGRGSLNEAARMECDMVMAAIVGCAGLAPTMAAIEEGRTIALANKESLVTAGALMMDKARKRGATILPVDSEHNAIFQCLEGQDSQMVRKLILTASGGPFRTKSRAEMAAMTPEQAVAHPNWSMGAKISVDSATMMNKGLELIEASHLFGLPEDRIDILVHPQSVIHSMVDYEDGSVLAQLGSPDMRVPIAHCLAYPKRMATPAEPLDLAKLGQLTFEAPNTDRFPALRLAREAARAGGAAPIILNAANEIAVAAFLDRQIGFLEICVAVEEVMQQSADAAPSSIEAVLDLDDEIRARTKSALSKLAA